MCANCEARKLCERLDRQIKNIEAGGSINPDALATIIREARDKLEGYANAASIIGLIASGTAMAAVLGVDITKHSDDEGHSGGVH